MTTKKKLGILILRVQPLHDGHKQLIQEARQNCDNLIIIIGSANSPRTIKNPFTYREREIDVITFLTSQDIAVGTYVYPINDYKYSDVQWLSDVAAIIEENNKNNKFEVAIFGHMKEGNNYLKWFPQYKFENVEATYKVNATQIRTNLFESGYPSVFSDTVVEDWKYFQKEKELFGNYPFPETLNFNCGDVILECSGHILLIQRGRAPGRGTWALVGGFKNATETFIDCAIRELYEETNVRIPEKVLRGSIVSTKIFDASDRGMGLPRVTMGVHIKVELDKDGKLPKANGSDDAMVAQWFPVEKIMNDMDLFDDHKDIISVMCGVQSIPAHKNSRFRFQS